MLSLLERHTRRIRYLIGPEMNFNVNNNNVNGIIKNMFLEKKRKNYILY